MIELTQEESAYYNTSHYFHFINPAMNIREAKKYGLVGSQLLFTFEVSQTWLNGRTSSDDRFALVMRRIIKTSYGYFTVDITELLQSPTNKVTTILKDFLRNKLYGLS